jgi:hypothetical protein
MDIRIQEENNEQQVRSVFLMSSEQIDDHWGNIQMLMTECPGYYDFYTPEWTYQQAKSGGIQVWALSDGMIRGIIMTQILVFPAQKVFEIIGAAGIGLLEFFDEMEKVFEYIAADAGCKTILARCRPGFERLLRKKHVLKQAVLLYRPVALDRRH